MIIRLLCNPGKILRDQVNGVTHTHSHSLSLSTLRHCHPREGGDPVPNRNIQQGLPSINSVQRHGIPAFAGMTRLPLKKEEGKWVWVWVWVWVCAMIYKLFFLRPYGDILRDSTVEPIKGLIICPTARG
ncbi:MAG: hypothetical protein D4R64_06140 [Porphyromonadaceae bacterium]|nr:MAG: hypothetical protein D4R64_06140 [Porphyromonadaceae bacterium]